MVRFFDHLMESSEYSNALSLEEHIVFRRMIDLPIYRFHKMKTICRKSSVGEWRSLSAVFQKCAETAIPYTTTNYSACELCMHRIK